MTQPDLAGLRGSIGNAAAWENRRELREAFDALVADLAESEQMRTRLSGDIAERNGAVTALSIGYNKQATDLAEMRVVLGEARNYLDAYQIGCGNRAAFRVIAAIDAILARTAGEPNADQ